MMWNVKKKRLRIVILGGLQALGLGILLSSSPSLAQPLQQKQLEGNVILATIRTAQETHFAEYKTYHPDFKNVIGFNLAAPPRIYKTLIFGFTDWPPKGIDLTKPHNLKEWRSAFAVTEDVYVYDLQDGTFIANRPLPRDLKQPYTNYWAIALANYGDDVPDIWIMHNRAAPEIFVYQPAPKSQDLRSQVSDTIEKVKSQGPSPMISPLIFLYVAIHVVICYVLSRFGAILLLGETPVGERTRRVAFLTSLFVGVLILVYLNILHAEELLNFEQTLVLFYFSAVGCCVIIPLVIARLFFRD